MIFDVAAELETPAMISRTRVTENAQESVPFIPGRVFRGASANAWIDETAADPASSPAFTALFLAGGVHFGDLRISNGTPWPLTSRQCRVFPEDHGVIDLLLARMAGKAPKAECPACEAKREIPQGFRIEDPGGLRNLRVTTLDVAHVGIDPLTLKAASGQFHSTRVLARRQYLAGRIWADEAGGDALRQFFDGGRTLRVGRGRSRGQGRLKAWISERVEPPGEELASRILEFNRQAWEKFPALADNLMFSCTLRSAAFVLDEWLLSRSYLIPADFGSDEVFQSYHLATWACGTTRISGWHAAAQLPKAEITAIAAGSCFLFSRDWPGGSDEAECARLASVLSPLECRGVGERRQEGFGEAVFCDRFHSDRAAGEKE